jgi:hypothetical protein
MKYKPNPLLYGVAENFYSSFKLAITMRSPVDHTTLVRAVRAAMNRYPYFSVSPERERESIVLTYNPRPVQVFDDERCAVLGSEECNGHLLCFGCRGNQIFLHASHYIADGMGINPLLKTVLYLYVAEKYGTDGLQTEPIHLPGVAVSDEEYAYPFPDESFEIDNDLPLRKAPDNAYGLNPDAFDKDGLYAYHLHIPQRAMMSKANPSDGSPVSFLSVMMYRALCSLDAKIELPVVVHVQHQYRQALRTPINRHSLVSYIPAFLPPRARNWHVEQQNTVLRGQIILGSEVTEDLQAVNRIIDALPCEEDASLAQKKAAMHKYVAESIEGKTFGISYVGKMDWCGLDRYVEDLHAHIGEKHTDNMLLVEVMTVGEDFSLTFMQSGRGESYLNAFIEEMRSLDIPIRLVGEERYNLCNTSRFLDFES